jgi:hypothetical protein
MIKEKVMFKKILKEWGHDILFQRRISDDFVYSETLERYTTRSHMPRKSALMTAKEEVPEGIFSNSDLLYYFEEEVMPKSGDRIYEESFSDLYGAIIYAIDEAYPVRGRYGQLAYWIVGATKEVPS